MNQISRITAISASGKAGIGQDGERLRARSLSAWLVGALPILLALASAALFVLAMPPHDLWPLALVGVAPFYLAVRNLSPWRAAGLAWLMGWAGNLAGFAWAVSFLVQFAHLPWAISLGVVAAVCAYQAIAYALWAWICSWLARRARVSWVLSAPLCMILVEATMPYLFKYYLALSVWRAWPLTQAAELGGPAAVSGLIILVNLLLAETLLALGQRRVPGLAVRLGALVSVLVIGGGVLRAAQVADLQEQAPKLKVGLVQPNFGITSRQDREQKGDYYIQTLRQATLDLSRQEVDLVIWPESSWPYLFDRALASEFPSGHPWELRPGARGRLLAGMLSHTFGAGSDVYNSAVLFTESGQITGRYDKNHLVPFAEYIPWGDRYPDWARQARKQLPDWPDITPGTQSIVMTDGELRIGPLICSEDLDVSYVHRVARLNPNLLVLVGSDGWLGGSAGPWQHRALATFRAIETRRELVRDMNTGVSTVIDALGRVQLEGPLYNVPYNHPRAATLLVGQVALLETFALGPYATPYLPYACLLMLVIGAIIGLWPRPRKAR